MANSISSVTTGTGGIVLESVDTSGNTNIKSGTTTIVAVTSTGAAVTGTLSASGGIAKASLPTGSVLQVVQGSTTTLVTVSSTSFVTTGITGSITPLSATNKILITVSFQFGLSAAATGYPTIFRGTTAGTNLGTSVRGFGGITGSGRWNMTFLDSPSTTSSQSYTVGLQVASGGQTCGCNDDSIIGSITLTEVVA